MKPERIIIHHSATADTGSLSWGAIRYYHTVAKGWADIGYHAGAEMVRGRPECLYGRPDTMAGAHCRGQNRKSLGFCFVGDYDREAPSEELLQAAARRVIVPWLIQYGLTPLSIRGHWEYSPKTCPGLLFDLDRLRAIAAEILKEHTDV